MGFLEGLADFGVGATQGVNQGLDLYSKYAQIQEQNKARDTQDKLDKYLQDSVAKGDFNDHAAGLRKYGDFALSVGKADIYSAAAQHADALEQAQLHKTGLQAFQVINTGDVKSALPLLNQFADKAGLGAKYDIRATSDGKTQLLSTVGGKTTVKDYDDPVALQHDALKLIEPALFNDTGDYLKYETEGRKADADIAQSGASAIASIAQANKANLTGPAEVQQSLASAAASKAAAAENYAQAAQVAPNAAAERGLKATQSKYYDTQTQAEVGKAVKDMLGTGANDLPGPKFANADSKVLIPFATEIMKSNGTDMNTGISTAAALLDPSTKPSINAHTGEITLGDQTYKLTPVGLRLLAGALAQNRAVQDAANQ